MYGLDACPTQDTYCDYEPRIEASTRQSPRAQSARTLTPQAKRPFGRISLSRLDFRWAPEQSVQLATVNPRHDNGLRWAPD
jgi:hypothetical protein